MKESEKDIERKLNRDVKKLGGWSIKLLPFLVKGLPDRLVLFPGGVLCFAEIKTTGEAPTKIQKYILAKLRNLGFKTFVVESSAQVTQLIYEMTIDI